MICFSLIKVLETVEVPESSFTPEKGGSPILIPKHQIASIRAYVPRYSRLRRTQVVDELVIEIKADANVVLEAGTECYVELIKKNDQFRIVRVLPLLKLDFTALGKLLTKSTAAEISFSTVKKEAV